MSSSKGKIDYTKETIGVIGGCGVAAANELLARIEKKLTALGCADDHQMPQMVLFQATQAPSRIAFASKTSEESFAPMFIDIGKKLKACGATLCCIPCNTAHCAVEEIEREVGLPFINIIEETLAFIQTTFPRIKRAGLLCSSGTRISKLYQITAQRTGSGIEIVLPDQKYQSSVDEGIASVKAGQQYSDYKATQSYFLPAADDVRSNGAEVIILGCTEIPLAIREKEYKGTPIIDTIDVLANACIRECKK